MERPAIRLRTGVADSASVLAWPIRTVPANRFRDCCSRILEMLVCGAWNLLVCSAIG